MAGRVNRTSRFLPVAVIGCVAGIPALLIATIVLACQSGALGAGCASPGSGPGGGDQAVGGQRWTGEQLSNAQTIITVAMTRRLPRRAAVVAAATAIVESQLRNLPYGDRDSLGLFQQRPSQGWGSPEDILNPSYAAGKFYEHLVAIRGWPLLPAGVAEQAVQSSAFPDRYAPEEAPAGALVGKFWQGPDNPPPGPGMPVPVAFAGCPDRGGSNLPVAPVPLPPGFQLPDDPRERAAVSFALAQVGKPYVWGATGPDAFDCSGLTQAAWAHAGVAISRTTGSQVHDGIAVAAISQAQPGDLLFIPGDGGTAADPGHVGMYVGSGLVVNAYDSRRGVIAESLDAWTRNVVAIRHIAGHTLPTPPGSGGDPSP